MATCDTQVTGSALCHYKMAPATRGHGSIDISEYTLGTLTRVEVGVLQGLVGRGSSSPSLLGLCDIRFAAQILLRYFDTGVGGDSREEEKLQSVIFTCRLIWLKIGVCY